MKEVRTILHKYNELKNIKATARFFNISKNTLRSYLRSFESSEYNMDHLCEINEEQLEQIVYKGATEQNRARRHRFDQQIDHFIKELRRKGVTRQLLWQEYRAKDKDGYGYSQFCEALNVHVKHSKLTLALNHPAGRTMMIDYAGQTIDYVDPITGLIEKAQVLVVVLPCSQKTFAIALASQSTKDFVYGITQALEYFGGVPQYMISDNLKAYVTKANRYEPQYNNLSVQLAEHYGMDMQATRVAKPQDKASVENMVKTVYTRLYAPIRDKVFDGLDQINEAFAPLLEAHNDKPFQKKQGSRNSIFDQYEKQALRPLPANRFEVKNSTQATVQNNYHIFLGEDKQYYSVPYKYAKKKVTVIYTTTTVEIYLKSQRIAIHNRLHSEDKYKFVTTDDHRPPKHKIHEQISNYDEGDFTEQAQQIGPHTEWAIRHIITHQPNQDQAYKSCIGILRLANNYGNDRLEKAALRCQLVGKANYTIIDNILRKNLDKQQGVGLIQQPPMYHNNIRGPEQFN